MKLIDGWKTIATQAWSVKFNYVGAIASALEALNALAQVLPVLEPLLPPGWFAVVALICVVGSIVSRFIPQPAMHEAIAEKKAAS